MNQPIKITKNSNNIHIATFNYLEGIKYADLHDLTQTSTLRNIYTGWYYIVINGEIQTKIGDKEFLLIKRILTK